MNMPTFSITIELPTRIRAAGEQGWPLLQQQDSLRDGGDEEVGREDVGRAEGARLAEVGGDQGQLGGEQIRRRRVQGQGRSRRVRMVSRSTASISKIQKWHPNSQPIRHFSLASLTQLVHQVREARELLDEALRELRRSDRGEGGAGQSRADGKGVRRDARTAAGPSDAGDVHSHWEGLKAVFVPF